MHTLFCSQSFGGPAPTDPDRVGLSLVTRPQRGTAKQPKQRGRRHYRYETAPLLPDALPFRGRQLLSSAHQRHCQAFIKADQ